MTIRSLNFYHIQTRDFELTEGLDISPLVDLHMPAAPILWEHEGAFALVPVQHIQEILEAEKRVPAEKKTAWRLTRVQWADAIPLDYDMGCTLARRNTR